MKPFLLRLRFGSALALGIALSSSPLSAQDTDTEASSPEYRVLAIQGKVLLSRGNTGDWVLLHELPKAQHYLKPGDHVKTTENSSLTIRWGEQSPRTFDQRSDFIIEDPKQAEKPARLNFFQGLLYYFHRDGGTDDEIRHGDVSAAVRGTEYTFEVQADGTVKVTVMDGEVELTNPQGIVRLKNNEQGLAVPNEAPTKIPVLDTVNIIQWLLYYPGVLDPEELDWTAEERSLLAESWSAYRTGDLLAALEANPIDRTPVSNAEKVYRAALLLAVGRVEDTQALLEGLTENAWEDATSAHRAADALRKLIATVQGRPTLSEARIGSRMATEWMTESYAAQALGRLREALDAARAATEVAPQFGFAWARLAELQFGFGNNKLALRSLEKALALSPRHAQAWMVRGFIHAARNDMDESMDAFDQALTLEPGLGHAWLGRGLARIRLGRIEEGREDLLMAASMEPQRSLLRSYLGKAFDVGGDPRRALEELERAKTLDPKDPTPWLYSALILQSLNRINEAARELEESKRLNDNRRIYRSGLLLDQDQAVRGANLANVYSDAGLREVSVREAARAVQDDYANYAAHAFLANSFNELRDPTQVELRYESAWFSEYLMANLLAPVGAGILSQTVSDQEYSPLFERNRSGIVSVTEYLSRGDWSQAGAVHGRYDNVAYAVEENYSSRNGQRANNDFEQLTLSMQVKLQLTPQDSVFVRSYYYDAEGGDLAQAYSPNGGQRNLRFEETQEPFLVAGYHHRWAPGVHSLVLGGYIDDMYHLTNPEHPALFHSQSANNLFFGNANLDYRSQQEIYTAEIQQIWQQPKSSLIGGARYQGGEFDSRSRLTSSLFGLFASTPPPLQEGASDFSRASVYGYANWQPVDPLTLTAGLTYDNLKYPANLLSPPLTPGTKQEDQISPKAGFIWAPDDRTLLRAGYTRSLGGVSFDQSFRLEPTQIAGFTQTYRSVIPESVQGSIPAQDIEIWGTGLERRFGHGTYVGVEGQFLESSADRELGVYSVFPNPSPSGPSLDVEIQNLAQRLDYQEKTLLVNAHQLLGNEWVLGGIYRLSEAELDQAYPSVELDIGERAVLHQARLFLLYHHPSGFFGSLEGVWSRQSNHGYAPELPGDDFWQMHVFVGYRWAQRRVEARLGILNLTDQDYRLNPLNLTPELPRERTLAARLRWHF